MADVVEIVLRATDGASAALSKASASVTSLGSSIQASAATTGAAVAKIGTAAQAAGAQVQVVGAITAQVFGGPVGEAVNTVTLLTSSALKLGAGLRLLPALQAAVGVAMNVMLGPIGLVTLGLTALIAAIVFITGDGEKKVTQSAKVIGKAFREDLAAGIRDTNDQLNHTLAKYAEVDEAARKTAGEVTAAAKALSDATAAGIDSGALKQAGISLDELGVAAVETYELLGDSAGKLTNDVGRVVTDLDKNTESIVNSTTERLKRLVAAIGDEGVQALIQSGRDMIKTSQTSIESIIAQRDKPGGLVEALVSGYEKADDKTKKILDAAKASIVKKLDATAEAARKPAQDLADNISNPLLLGYDGAQQRLDEFATATIDKLKEILALLTQIGTGVDNVGNDVSDLADNLDTLAGQLP